MKKCVFAFASFTVLFMLIIPTAVGLCLHEEGEDAKNISGGEIKFTYLDAKSGELKEAKLEEYIVGVIAAEMPALYHIEALKAQAVAARSYIIKRMNEENPDHPKAAVCNDFAHCKAHIEKEEAKEKWGEEKWEEYWDKLNFVAEATQGEVMTYEEEVLEAFFFAGSGGKTENSEDVWGEERPYLKSVESPGDSTNEKLLSKKEISNSEVRELLKGIDKSVEQGNKKIKIEGLTRTEGGSVKTIKIEGIRLKGVEARKLFGLKSANFLIEANETEVVFNVRGNGHGVGMSQSGANYMAENGKNYTEILSHYYTNIQIVSCWDKNYLF